MRSTFPARLSTWSWDDLEQNRRKAVTENSIDVLAIAAHPDDVELWAGGTICSLTARGLTVGIIDLTQGELGSRGSVEERREEAAVAATIMGVRVRENLKNSGRQHREQPSEPTPAHPADSSLSTHDGPCWRTGLPTSGSWSGYRTFDGFRLLCRPPQDRNARLGWYAAGASSTRSRPPLYAVDPFRSNVCR